MPKRHREEPEEHDRREELRGILNDVPLIPLLDAVRKMDGLSFTHPTKGDVIFSADRCIDRGPHSVRKCLELSSPTTSASLPDDIRHALLGKVISVDQLAAIRAFSGGDLRHALNHFMDAPLQKKALYFAAILLSGLHALPDAYRVEREDTVLYCLDGLTSGATAVLGEASQNSHCWEFATFTEDASAANATKAATSSGSTEGCVRPCRVRNVSGFDVVLLLKNSGGD